MVSGRKSDGSKPRRAARTKANKPARADKDALKRSKKPKPAKTARKAGAVGKRSGLGESKGGRKFIAKQAASVASGAEDLPTARKVWAAMKSGALAKGALGLAQAHWLTRQDQAMQDAKALLADRKRIRAKGGEDKFLRQVIGRMAKPVRDMTERPLYTNIVNAKGGTPVKLAFAKGTTPITAKLATKNVQINAGNALLTARAGKDYIVRQADGKGAPWVVDSDLFEASYLSVGKGRFIKNTRIPYGYIVADRDQVFYSKEGPIQVAKGDIILIGTKGEAWGMRPGKFAARYSTDLPKSGAKRAATRNSRVSRLSKSTPRLGSHPDI